MRKLDQDETEAPPKREHFDWPAVNPVNRWAGSWLIYSIEWIAWKLKLRRKR